MQILNTLIDYILHIDHHLDFIIRSYHIWTYAIMFLIIFVETGFIIMPFLPGDSLLFAIGAFCAKGSIDLISMSLLLFFAAILGDSVNYYLGKKLGPKIFDRDDSVWLNKKNLQKAQTFYEKYGSKTIIIARFIPIVRSFAPFVAGIGNMSYKKFMTNNLIGGCLWVFSFIGLGYFFGNLEFVQRNFKFVMVAIIIISVAPAIFEFLKERQLKA
jgi:membrane-associated protein